MAILINSLFGGLSGKLGDVVYRKRGGKTIVARRPSARQSPLTEKEILGHKIFGLTGKISKAINGIELLKYFWHPISAKNQSIYHVIFKKNYAIVRIEDFPSYILLTPSQGFNLINPSLYPGESNLVIECKSLGERSEFDTQVEKYVAVAGIVVMKDPTIENISPYQVMSFKSKKYLFYPNDYLSINLEFTGGQLEIYESYSVKKVFAVFVTMDEEERPVQHSLTFTSE
jgi:hypothetical protein